MEDKKYTFTDLVQITAHLRSPEGCPWDREQTHQSLKKSLLEEAYEVMEAIDNEDPVNLCEELGDLLLQVTLHSEIAGEQGHFDIDAIIHGICTKLIRRHPHVFGSSTAEDSEQALKQWEEIKKDEKASQSAADSMKSIPKAMAALIRSEKVQKKAAGEGFDFSDYQGALEKVREELAELEAHLRTPFKKENPQIDEEFGDLLFSMVNLSRFLGINAEFSLTNAIEKFINRFEGVEKLALEKGKRLRQMTLAEMDVLWEEYKKS